MQGFNNAIIWGFMAQRAMVMRVAERRQKPLLGQSGKAAGRRRP